MERDPQPESAPLFRLASGALTRDAVLRELETKLLRVGIPPDGYRGHSFRKGAAQEAHNNGLTQEEIQTLGRWSSGTVQRYFKNEPAERYPPPYAIPNWPRLSHRLSFLFGRLRPMDSLFGSFSPRGARSKGDQQPNGRVAYNQKPLNILGVDTDSRHPCPARKEDS
jgi:hypothetical protein